MERHKRKARLVWALAQAAQQNFRHSLASTHRHTRHVLTAAVYINTHQHTLHFFAHMRAAKKGHLEHTRTARLFSMSLHTRKGPQPNRFLPEGNATWGTVKCPSGRVGRAQKCATSAAMSATKTAAVVSVWRMRKLTLYAGIPSGGYHVSGASRRVPSANMQRRSLNNHPLTSTGGRADTK